MAIKEDIVRSVFSGSDIFSKAARKKFGVKDREPKKPGTTPTPAATSESQGVPEETITILKIITKNSMAMPGIARDMNVLRQNLQKLVTLKGGDKSAGADAFFLKQGERESAFEAQRQRTSPTPAAGGATSSPSGGGVLESIVGMFNGGFMSAIKSIFNPRSLLKVLGKVFLPIAIIGTLFSGIKDGFERYKETGSFSEATIAGLGGMLNFLSFGLFGEDTLRSLWDNVNSFFEPITSTISNIFNELKAVFKNMFGGVVDIKDDAPPKAETPKPTMPAMPEGPKSPEEFAKSLESSGAVPQGLMGGLQGVLEAGKTGNFELMIEKSKELQEKYPSSAPSETAPTPLTKEGIPLDQAQRNYELNKSLSGSVSGALGVPIPMPNAPTAASPSGAMSGGSVSGPTLAPPSPTSSAPSGGASGTVTASQTAPAPINAEPPTSGSSLSTASSQIAEAQRMESSADAGSVINAPTNNSTTSSTGKEPSTIASAYDEEFAKLLATT